MKEFRKIVFAPGEITKYESVFEENTRLRTGVPTRMGKVERLDYTTDVYENGITYKKTAYVYLPYCYDAADKSRKYNVVYFQHGNTCEPAMFAVGGNKYMFDMLFDDDTLDPCIIVFITYYMDPMRDSEVRIQTGQAETGDGLTPGIPMNYYKEIVQDIIPAVETRYNCYLEENTDAGIKASRDHRAFAGYSRGTAWTWRMIHYDFEYFRWFCPTSGGVPGDPIPFAPDGKPFETLTNEEALEYVTEPIKAHPELPYYIFAACGGNTDGLDMKGYLNYFFDKDVFSYGLDPVKNNFYFSLSDFYHTDYLIPYYFWNSFKVIFKGMD